jgi:hypothetical protein
VFALQHGCDFAGQKVIEGRLRGAALGGHDLKNRLAIADFLLDGKNGAQRRGLLDDCREPTILLVQACASSRSGAVLAAAGYLARANDHPPGSTVMLRGLSRLTDIELGAQNLF